MSVNAQIVSILLVLAVAAAALRIATGPIALKDSDTLYAMAKSGPAAGSFAEGVQLAVSDARPGR
ncbi:MAG: hypothetical protein ACXWKT_03160 [Caulobacteraceae bacterium]